MSVHSEKATSPCDKLLGGELMSHMNRRLRPHKLTALLPVSRT